MKRKRKERKQSLNARWSVVALFALALLFSCLCMGGATLLDRIANRTSQQTPVVEVDPRNATLTLAYSPEKAVLMRQLAERFNSQDLRTADRQRMQVELVELTPDVMVEEAVGPAPRFQAMTPDSSLWIDQLDRRWAAQQQVEEGAIAPSLVGESVRYAVSPVVLAMWEDVARDLGWPEQPVGWKTIQERATNDAGFRWSHPSTSQASGLLATLA